MSHDRTPPTATKKLDRCTHCGQAEAEHHAFVAVVVPIACQCPPEDWGCAKKVPAICRTFERMSPMELEICKRCEHEAPCHGEIV